MTITVCVHLGECGFKFSFIKVDTGFGNNSSVSDTGFIFYKFTIGVNIAFGKKFVCFLGDFGGV
jgi:hypothetical protein